MISPFTYTGSKWLLVIFIPQCNVSPYFFMYSGQYIRSDIETIRRVINDLNSDLLTEGELTLNDYYYALGLRQTTTGEQLGWKYTGSKDEQLRIRFSAQITEKNEPCLVLEHYTPPRYLHVDY